MQRSTLFKLKRRQRLILRAMRKLWRLREFDIWVRKRARSKMFKSRWGRSTREIGKPPEAPQISQATMMLPAVGPRPVAEVIQARLAKAPLFQGFGEEDWTLFLTAYDRDTELHIECS